MNARSSTVATLRDLLAATDPGGARLRLAARAVLVLGGALLALSTLTRLVHQNGTLALLGAAVAMFATLTLSDDTPRARAITLLLVPIVASAALALGVLAIPHSALGFAILFAIGFAAVWIRRHGPRGVTLGMTAVQAYIFAAFFDVSRAHLAWAAAAFAVATAVALAVHFVVLPERPERRLAAHERAFRASLAVLLRHTARGLAKGRWERGRDMLVRRDVLRLNEVGLALDQEVERAAAGELPGEQTPPDARLRLFEMELGAGRFVQEARALAKADDTTPAARRAAARAARVLAGFVVARSRGGERRLDRERRVVFPDAERARHDETTRAQLAPLERAAMELLEAKNRELPCTAADLAAPARPAAPESAPPAGAAAALHPMTRQAIKATLALAIATLLGDLLSSERWYWATFAAFVVFSRTVTAGETLFNAWQRVLGTALGVAGGLVAATLLRGNEAVELVLIFAGLFLTAYTMRVSFTAMAFFITVVLALLYSLTGRFTPAVLYLRILQTFVGSAVGALVARFVLPSHSRDATRAALADVLTTSAAFFRGLAEHATGRPISRALLADARALERKLQALLLAARPLMSRLVARPAPELDALVHRATALVLYARQLLGAIAASPMTADDHDRMRRALLRLADNAEIDAAAVLRKEPDRARESIAPLFPEGPGEPLPLRWLTRIDQVLTGPGYQRA